MSTRLSKSDLVEIVAKLLRTEASSEETLQWLKLIERNVSNPYSDHGDEDDNWFGNGKKLFY